MALLEEMARSQGIEKVALEPSLVSKRFCEDLGYETIRKSFIQLPKGKRLDYLEMQKSLNKGQDLGLKEISIESIGKPIKMLYGPYSRPKSWPYLDSHSQVTNKTYSLKLL